ncbi:MAG TPA: sigma-70 family RNA polymerase sigma factor [Candidatus Hydrogenedentes bacterium]|nr:sigma-70 family RNA polymerase sigma factor [Candidatus Hydrogenedentota bacterium]HOK90223.1 sigma-70 family RNA polymerase sigma factor [Candidatus Hydrogenedentota bacterium]HOV60246.1 sigma-70 family RNA polymerase sigma factor [Candidatus Hydrogenedentota bacterium]HPO30484.1 sigma-70 family RNA polymerase sigma factor [Candidatus Hydrogenedentota bacterium]
MEPDDWILIARAKTGDIDAFAMLVRRYQAPVFRFCEGLLASREDAEEVTQDCFVSLYRALPRLEPRARFSTLLFGSARNFALNRLRDRKRRQAREQDPRASEATAGGEISPDAACAAGELAGAIRETLEAVPEPFRSAFLLREETGMDYAAIAEILGCPIGTVRSRIARAREIIRASLVEKGLLP